MNSTGAQRTAVLDAFHAAGGEFVDLPVADRARRLLELAGRIPISSQA